MSEMVERIAALFLGYLKPSGYVDGKDVYDAIDRSRARDAACAAILAMREPTAEMVSYAGAPGRDEADDIWRDMIDKALEEPK